MRGFILIPFFVVGCSYDEFAQRTPPLHIPKEHTAEAAGTDKCPEHMAPSVTKRNVLGYTNCTTFGMDYLTFACKPGRVFPGVWPRKCVSFSDKYATDGPHVKDIIALAPFRRAVKEAKLEKLEACEGEGHE